MAVAVTLSLPARGIPWRMASRRGRVDVWRGRPRIYIAGRYLYTDRGNPFESLEHAEAILASWSPRFADLGNEPPRPAPSRGELEERRRRLAELQTMADIWGIKPARTLPLERTGTGPGPGPGFRSRSDRSSELLRVELVASEVVDVEPGLLVPLLEHGQLSLRDHSDLDEVSE